MPREKELMHEHLEQLYQRFGRETAMITLRDAAQYCGLDPRTLLADKTFPVRPFGRQYRVALINLARWLAA